MTRQPGDRIGFYVHGSFWLGSVVGRGPWDRGYRVRADSTGEEFFVADDDDLTRED